MQRLTMKVAVLSLSSFSHRFIWIWSDLGTAIIFSRGSVTCQWFFKCHWMDLMWRCPDMTCFSVAVRRAIRNMNCLTEQVWLFLSRLDQTLGEVETISHKVENLLGDKFILVLIDSCNLGLSFEFYFLYYLCELQRSREVLWSWRFCWSITGGLMVFYFFLGLSNDSSWEQVMSEMVHNKEFI